MDSIMGRAKDKSKGKTGLVFIKLSFMCLISFRFEL